MNIDDIIAGLEDEGVDVGAASDEEVGRIVRRRLARPPAASTRPAGFQRMALKRTGMGLPKATFANNDPAGTAKSVEIEPQRDFQPERLIATVVTVPASKLGVASIKIGDVEQLPGGNPIPLVMFEEDVVGGGLDLSLCKAGTKLTVKYEVLTTLGAAEGGDVISGFYGQVAGQ